MGTLITHDSRDLEVNSTSAQAKLLFQKIKNLLVLTSENESVAMRQNTLHRYAESILIYGCEGWTITKSILKRMENSGDMILMKNVKDAMEGKKDKHRIYGRGGTNRGVDQRIRRLFSLVTK